MFCIIFIILVLLQYSTSIVVFPSSDSDNDNVSTQCDCTCDVEIDIVSSFIEDLGAVRKHTDEIGSDIFQMQKKLFANRDSRSTSCMEAAAGSFKSGIYDIQLEKFAPTPFAVWCNEDIEYGGWMVIQRRESDSVDFYRGWQDYKDGFGITSGNYWMGLKKLHVLTSSCEQELYIEMRRFNGESYYAKYSEFLIGDESENFVLKKLGTYTGNSKDSLKPHIGIKFTTFDRDNDGSEKNCAGLYQSAWWFTKCYNSNLNGVYRKENINGDGVDWNGLAMNESLKFAQMMIRPTENCLRRLSLRKTNA